MKRTMYVLLGMLVWRVGQRYMRRRAGGMRPAFLR